MFTVLHLSRNTKELGDHFQCLFIFIRKVDIKLPSGIPPDTDLCTGIPPDPHLCRGIPPAAHLCRGIPPNPHLCKGDSSGRSPVHGGFLQTFTCAWGDSSRPSPVHGGFLRTLTYARGILRPLTCARGFLQTFTCAWRIPPRPSTVQGNSSEPSPVQGGFLQDPHLCRGDSSGRSPVHGDSSRPSPVHGEFLRTLTCERAPAWASRSSWAAVWGTRRPRRRAAREDSSCAVRSSCTPRNASPVQAGGARPGGSLGRTRRGLAAPHRTRHET